MGFQPGVCAIGGYLIAAWKNKPVASSFPLDAANDLISYAQFDGEQWQLLGTIPGVSSIGPSLAADTSDYTAPAVYAAWKGAGTDIAVYFSAFAQQGANASVSTWTWQVQTQIENAASFSGPAVACLQSDGPSAVVVLWAGQSLNQVDKGPFGDFTVWYLTHAIDYDTHLTSIAGLPLPVPNAASANFVQVAVADADTLYIVWFDNNTKRWTCQLAQLDGVSEEPVLSMGAVITLPNYANAGGYSMGNFDFGPTTQNPIYVVWMDESNRIFGSSFDSLAAGEEGTPIPGAGGQAATLMGCSLAELGSKLYAVWADLDGQLQYAVTDDGTNWQYAGPIHGAMSGPDAQHQPRPVIHPLPQRPQV